MVGVEIGESLKDARHNESCDVVIEIATEKRLERISGQIWMKVTALEFSQAQCQ